VDVDAFGGFTSLVDSVRLEGRRPPLLVGAAVSLLSDLIAELSALIERSRESRTQLSSANDQLEQVFDVIKESTVGSASAQVTEGLGRLRSAASKLEEAKRLLAAGAEDRNDPAVAGTALTGMRWGAALLGPNAEPGRNLTGAFGKRRLAIALHDLIEHLPHRLNGAYTFGVDTVLCGEGEASLLLFVVDR
jgi:hypothetical protein